MATVVLIECISLLFSTNKPLSIFPLNTHTHFLRLCMSHRTHLFCLNVSLKAAVKKGKRGKLESEGASYQTLTKSSLADGFDTCLFNSLLILFSRRLVNYDSARYEGKFIEPERCILGVTVSPLPFLGNLHE